MVSIAAKVCVLITRPVTSRPDGAAPGATAAQSNTPLQKEHGMEMKGWTRRRCDFLQTA